MLVGLLAALALQCSSKPVGDDDLLGEYSTERTLIVTGIGEPNQEGCGVPQAPVSGAAAFRNKVSSEGGKVRVKELVGGCVFEARIEDDVVTADNQACVIAKGAPLQQLGVTSRVYSVFRLDAVQKSVVSRSVTVATVTTGESRSCSVTEERIVGKH